MSVLMLRLAKGKRSRGIIKSKAEDFIVEEITANGLILEKDKKYQPEDLGLTNETDGKFSNFVLQKTDWNTSQALKEIARKFRRGVKSTGFAGTKDRASISTQLCSIFGVTPDRMSNIHIKDLSINGAWFGKEKVKMGDLMGNRFGITVREFEDPKNMENIIQELNGIFPNYYGEQRFGYRKTNFDVGLDILKGDFEGAAMRILTDTQNETNEEAVSARKQLASDLDFKAALNYFPMYLKYERYMIEYLSKYPGNYANAIRRIPRSISLMFIHSVEAQMFNMELEERIKTGDVTPERSDPVCYENSYGFPDVSTVERYNDTSKRAFLVGNIVGYDTNELTEFESRLLEELGLTVESFKVNGINELHSKGTSRALFAPLRDIKYNYEKEEDCCALRFSLPAGAYATILIDELIENKNSE